jgi:(p)ppGpp synthase/HD superfamily hydrolase
MLDQGFRMDAVNKAMNFAIAKHGDQKYGGDKPYVYHLNCVFMVLRRFGVDNEALLQAAFLHDVIEDTNTTYEEVEATFGNEVAELVEAVTNEEGINRKERHLKTYPKIRAVHNSIILKLADRIANVEETFKNKDSRNEKLFAMYVQEHRNFKHELYHPGQSPIAHQMWVHVHMLLT